MGASESFGPPSLETGRPVAAIALKFKLDLQTKEIRSIETQQVQQFPQTHSHPTLKETK